MTAATIDPILTETALRMFAEHCSPERLGEAEKAGWSEALWNTLSDSGLTRVGIDESGGGSGGTVIEAAELVRLAAYSAAQVPLAEALLIAGPVLASAGLPLPDGPVSVAPEPGEIHAERASAEWTLNGRATAVAWARISAQIVVLAESADGPVLAAVPTTEVEIAAGRNLAGEPRDTVIMRDVRVGTAILASRISLDAETWRARGAAVRALQIAGALEKTLELTVRHAKERHQFGRPIARFQAVGQLITLLGESVAQARMAAEVAVVSHRLDDAMIAKIIAGEAATQGAANAHQIHGAMGTTRECHLHWFTRRLWSWRDEFGAETAWARRLGTTISHRGSDGLWNLITATTNEGQN
ncbi:hypothetical protein AXA44_11740 [Rhodococcus sp. SC4]|nr:hypothetical protein AXA44_11740 [Rhodococcus sp. SC4]RZL84023.1 MAG: acyl-CoA dehydrogenase [Rhodococcus sp. (in: high G+C Gram-positive bacteria)]